MQSKILTLNVCLTLALVVPFSEVLAEQENLFLNCKITMMTLCVGDNTLEGCPNPFLPASSSTSDASVFSVSKISGKWTLTKKFTAELVPIRSDEEFFEFTFELDDEWARLRINRLTGELIELYGLPGREILAAKGTCEKVEKKF